MDPLLIVADESGSGRSVDIDLHVAYGSAAWDVDPIAAWPNLDNSGVTFGPTFWTQFENICTQFNNICTHVDTVGPTF